MSRFQPAPGRLDHKAPGNGLLVISGAMLCGLVNLIAYGAPVRLLSSGISSNSSRGPETEPRYISLGYYSKPNGGPLMALH